MTRERPSRSRGGDLRLDDRTDPTQALLESTRELAADLSGFYSQWRRIIQAFQPVGDVELTTDVAALVAKAAALLGSLDQHLLPAARKAGDLGPSIDVYLAAPTASGAALIREAAEAVSVGLMGALTAYRETEDDYTSLCSRVVECSEAAAQPDRTTDESPPSDSDTDGPSRQTVRAAGYEPLKRFGTSIPPYLEEIDALATRADYASKWLSTLLHPLPALGPAVEHLADELRQGFIHAQRAVAVHFSAVKANTDQIVSQVSQYGLKRRDAPAQNPLNPAFESRGLHAKQCQEALQSVTELLEDISVDILAARFLPDELLPRLEKACAQDVPLMMTVVVRAIAPAIPHCADVVVLFRPIIEELVVLQDVVDDATERIDAELVRAGMGPGQRFGPEAAAELRTLSTTITDLDPAQPPAQPAGPAPAPAKTAVQRERGAGRNVGFAEGPDEVHTFDIEAGHHLARKPMPPRTVALHPTPPEEDDPPGTPALDTPPNTPAAAAPKRALVVKRTSRVGRRLTKPLRLLRRWF